MQAAEQGTTADPAKKLSRSVTDVSPNVAVSHDIYLVYINKQCPSAGRLMIQRTEDLRRRYSDFLQLGVGRRHSSYNGHVFPIHVASSV